LRTIESGSGDDTLRVWEAATGECTQTLTGHEAIVECVAWNPAGTRIVSGSWDKTLRIWESRLEEALPMWRAAASRRRVRGKVNTLFQENTFLPPVLTVL